jgi:D-sedoheptulose 7-phosphate isomerase
MQYEDLIEETFLSCKAYVESALPACRAMLAEAIGKSISILESGGTLYFAGNGGSAADCSHIASELVGAFEKIATPLPAIAFTTDVAILTSVANDFSFDRVFLQQVQALVRPSDQLWLLSTSGESGNLLRAAIWAREHGISTVGLLGKNGGKLASQVDFPVIVPGDNTQRIQEVHILMLHTLAAALKHRFAQGIPQKDQ